MTARTSLSRREARRAAIAAQGLAAPRPTATITRRHLRQLFDTVGTIQLDAINVLERTQRLVLFSRLGGYDTARLEAMAGPGGELFEYWGHAASLLPMVHEPLFRWRMAAPGPYGDGPAYRARVEEWRRTNRSYIASILEEIRERGPLAASQLADPRRRDGEWWDRRSLGRQALEWLFFRGEVTAWRTAAFERVYDLPERVLPADVLARPTPTIDEAHRHLLLLAARSLGVATASDLADYYRLKPAAARPRVAELVDGGDLVAVAVEGWREAAYVVADGPRVRPRRDHATLLSPFDSLIWDRVRTERLFDFHFRIEVYVPAARRRHGYFVLPLLLGDQLVARFDLKADRQASALRVNASHLEPGNDADVVAPAAVTELRGLARWLGLAELVIVDRGDLAPALRRTTG